MLIHRLLNLGLLAGAMYGADFAQPYKDRLSGLNPRDPQSVCSARALLRDSMPKADLSDRAAMYRSFRSFYLRVIWPNEPIGEPLQPFQREILEWLSQERSFEGVRKRIEQRPDMRQAAAPWLDCGIGFFDGEGALYPAQDAATLLEFAPQLPQDLGAYVRFRAREDAQRIGEDGAIALSWEELRRRLGRWEAFVRTYPTLMETRAEVMPEIENLAGLFFFGFDNTPTYDRQTGKILPEVIVSWTNLASQDQTSHYQALAAGLLPRLKRNGNKLSKSDHELFQIHGFGDVFDRWLMILSPQ